jgi:hypothetical protein
MLIMLLTDAEKAKIRVHGPQHFMLRFFDNAVVAPLGCTSLTAARQKL